MQPLKKRTEPSVKSDVPWIFHPKRSRVHPKTLDDKQLSNKKQIIDAVPPINKSVPTTHQPQLDGNTSERPMTEVFEYNNLKKWSSRYALLKHDRDVLDLLPTSRQAQKFIPTLTTAEIKELSQASEKLIERQALGVWEWKEGTSTARLHKYRIPDAKTPAIKNRKFKFTGFAWKGPLGQQPPRITDLPDDISQGSQSLRWYWFKDLWLLYYFDD
ncbi:hypothetical protein PtB15_2B286 [Puccinia triticina]|nr:hypothetical protein PtB15_2B286 [Puccinia triticina]